MTESRSRSRSRSHPRSRSDRSRDARLTREEHKEMTRQALLKAALRLLGQNSFDSISLREVTREAGISPTAFYRHFDDMEELGLVLVEESFAGLRGMLRPFRPRADQRRHQALGGDGRAARARPRGADAVYRPGAPRRRAPAAPGDPA